MAASDFFFSIDLSDDPASRELLREVVARVLAQAGCGANGGAGVLDGLQSAVARSAAAGDPSCRVTFAAGAGRLEVVACSSAGELWKTVHPLA